MKSIWPHIVGIAAVLLLASCGRAGRMRHMLEQAEWMNLHDSAFTSDSVGRALVRYYDHWWHPADLRLRAYYMLGCAYRDLGEAPAAIHYYNIATEKADTAHADSASYATLFRVYGQMAIIYEQQNMPQEEIESLDKFSHFALLAHDTLSSIMGKERKVVAYYEMEDTAKVLQLTECVRQQYLRLGFTQKAARAYPTAIYVCTINKDYARAHQYMNIFEKESGLFDKNGYIEGGREIYYYSKGLYNLGMTKFDSAEHFFRLLINHGYCYEGYNGLLSVYRSKKGTDSIVKYSILQEQTLLEWASSRQTEAVIHSSAMYKYERNQNIALQKKEEAKRAQLVSFLLFSIVIILVLFTYIIYHKIHIRQKEQENKYKELVNEHKQKTAAYEALITEHHEALIEYQKQNNNFAALQESYKSLQQSLPDAIQKIENESRQRLNAMQAKIQKQSDIIDTLKMESVKNEELMEKEPIVNDFRNRADASQCLKSPRLREWSQLINTYMHHMPYMYAHMEIANLSNLELRISILTQLGFSTSEQTILLNTSDAVVSKTKANANHKLFGEKRATTFSANLKKCAYFGSVESH